MTPRYSNGWLEREPGNLDNLPLEPVPVMSNHLFGVMAGLVPAIRGFLAEARKKDVDARDKRGHDAA